LDTLLICSHNKYHMSGSSDSSDLFHSIKSHREFPDGHPLVILLYLDQSTFSPVLQVLLCPLMPRRHPLLSTSCPVICCVLLFATYTLSRPPLHGRVLVRRGSITPLILKLWIRWNEWPALSLVDLYHGESPPGDHGIWYSVVTRAGLDALKARRISCLCWKLNCNYSTVQSMPLFFLGGGVVHCISIFGRFSSVIRFIYCFTVHLMFSILEMVKPRKK